jgi:hypothetical protein
MKTLPLLTLTLALIACACGGSQDLGPVVASCAQEGYDENGAPIATCLDYGTEYTYQQVAEQCPQTNISVMPCPIAQKVGDCVVTGERITYYAPTYTPEVAQSECDAIKNAGSGSSNWLNLPFGDY